MTIFTVSVDLLTTIFENVASSYAKQEQLINPLCAHVSVPWMLEQIATGVFTYLQSSARVPIQEISNPEKFNQQYLSDISVEYGLTFRLVADHLNNEISSSKTVIPSLLFYLSTILLQFLLFRLSKESITISVDKDTSFNEGLRVLLNTVARYRAQTAGRVNEPLEKKFADLYFVRRQDSRGIWSVELTDRFSDTWWTTFFRDYDNIGLPGIENLP